MTMPAEGQVPAGIYTLQAQRPQSVDPTHETSLPDTRPDSSSRTHVPGTNGEGGDQADALGPGGRAPGF
jgi:hypothetical protein